MLNAGNRQSGQSEKNVNVGRKDARRDITAKKNNSF
jgi:hypothetical protein